MSDITTIIKQWNRRKLAVSACYALFWFQFVGILISHHGVYGGRPFFFWESQQQQEEIQYEMESRGEFFISTTPHLILFGVLSVMAFELLSFCTLHSGQWFHWSRIPVRGKHLDDLRPIDIFCIGFSKANTAPFTYFFFRCCWHSMEISWDWKQITIWNTLLPIPCLFVLFDITYALFHWILHWQCLYSWIHKHHHIQKAPSRATTDAVNVHPIEYMVGEYNHLWVVYLLTHLCHCRIHVLATILFLTIGGILAGINHTRYDVTIRIPYTSIIIYDSKAHDVHHRIPQSNYGQYTMLWDTIMGSYRPYNPNDRIHPDAQLDEITGKSKPWKPCDLQKSHKS